MMSTRDPPQNNRSTQAESEGIGKKIFQVNGHVKKVGIAILISDKID